MILLSAGELREIRRNPDNSRVTWRFNQGEWQTSTGRDFLELLEQPVAGTIYVDGVVVDGVVVLPPVVENPSA